MQIPILNGIWTDQTADFRTSLPVNVIPVPKETGLSSGYLRTADGIEQFASGPDKDRGALIWNGFCYRVMGTKLVRVNQGGTVDILGDVGSGIAGLSDRVSMTYSFDRMAVASGGRLYYWDGTTLTQVTDPDLGTVIDTIFTAGYFVCTDGQSLVVTDLADPTGVNPLKYGSSEFDPDPVVGLFPLSKEVLAINRFSIEFFDNVGGSGFPFAPIDGAVVNKGAIGTHMRCAVGETMAFVGSGRNDGKGEPPAAYILNGARAERISDREIDTILQGYSEYELSLSVMECRGLEGHQWLYIHLPDRTLVHDLAASQVLQQPVWFEMSSAMSLSGPYRARNWVYCYGQWLCGDIYDGRIGKAISAAPTQYGIDAPYQFDTLLVYNETRGAIIHQLELVGLPGRAPLGASPVVFCSYTNNGIDYSVERPCSAGKSGQSGQRMQWRRLGRFDLYRALRFRGVGKSHIAFARLDAEIEGLR